MKKLLIFVLLLQTVCLTAAAQNFIPIVVQQYPPLTVVAHTVVLELPQEGATLGSDLTVEGGDGTYSYLWTDADGHTLGTSSTLHIDRAGSYYLKVTDAHLCSVSTLFTATTSNAVILSYQVKTAPVRIHTLDMAATMVKKLTDIAPGMSANIAALQLPSGVYLVNYIYGDGTALTKRILIP